MALVYRNGRPYLYRSVRRGGRVATEYLGSGETALLMARLEAAERVQAERGRQAWEIESRRLEAEERTAAAYFEEVEALAEAAMLAAGFRRHKGQWRRRRG